jgi:acyl carrier protein
MGTSHDQILQIVMDTVSEVVGLDPGALTPQANLMGEYDLDSIELMEIGTRLERAFMVQIEPGQLFDAESASDVASYLYDKVLVA